ncbi:5'-3' exonuclease [Sorangium cellulosum]|uniref:5'-3' exonuclease n=1 Tax=Sorangium cellulosum TaxID=56 RepID=A0A4P2QCL6_SORCE|nr:5'-3' exonuclease H3TH domain-containing protein [Sorangium cellulosum]AUX27066.1 5'-3' exonuclease [Sorangium cellulosum]
MRLHLIDGTYELFRAHYSKRPDHRAPGGWDAKATVGVVASLLALLHHPDEEVTHLAVAFDNPIRSFRNDLFAGYKSDEGMDPALRAQLDPVEEAVRALGVVVWTMADFEADDALATAAARHSGEVEQVRILSPDKDFGQCLSGERVVQVDRRKERVIDEAALRAARGVGPASIPDFLALTGDDADGIPGLAGIGERTAAALLGAYGHIERIPSDPAAWTVAVRGADRIARVLNEEREAALLYRRLATLRTDVPLAERLDDLRFRGVPRARFEAWCDAMDVRTLKRRPTRWA